jgi:endonuclease/exonuclease/phosphatase family metal-dependent hydrolase
VSDAPQERAGSALRVVGYNLRDLKDDRRALLRVLLAVRPDVLCAQEVPRRLGSAWRLGRLARRAGLVPVCGGRGSGGTAVLVAPGVQVRWAGAARLPVEHWWTRTRGYAAVGVGRPGEPAVTVVSVHLGLTPTQRADHVDRILRGLPGLAGPPYIVVGDLNEPPGGPSWLALAALVRDGVTLGIGPDCPELPTFPARSPRRRIDAVLVSAGVRVRRLSPAGLRDGVADADLVAASDHLPVIADLAIDRLTSPGPCQ